MKAGSDRTDTHILIVDDERGLTQLIRRQMEGLGHRVDVCTNAEQALKWLSGRSTDLLLVDVHMPGMTGLELVQRLRRDERLPPTIVMSAYGAIEHALAAVQAGALDFLSKPFRLPELQLKVEVALERVRLERPASSRRRAARPIEEPESTPGALFYDMVGKSHQMCTLFDKITRVARFPSTVLIHGESGTGKELVARALHKASERRGAPFVAVNCGAIPANLLESELFGHVKGAFTDATSDRQGLFAQADGGTLFLDEIIDLPLHLQVSLLRVLQESEIRPVGSTSTQRVDVRVVAASAIKARQRVKQGLFREDLYFRLSVIELEVAALRERLVDLPLLTEHIVARSNKRLGTHIRGVHPHAMALLMSHTWPGNIRELQNVIEQACVLSESDQIEVSVLPDQIHGSLANASAR
ncbi:MAG TPA: hypothetical protein DCQ06_05905, partial [Myxococcales bacterium]|nr:hypothetical protein [Myxococcales bacterium]